MQNQMNNIMLKNEADMHRVQVHLLDKMYSSVTRKVSAYALDLANKAYIAAKIATNPLGTCSGYSRRCLGLPCKHDFKICIESGILQLADTIMLILKANLNMYPSVYCQRNKCITWRFS